VSLGRYVLDLLGHRSPAGAPRNLRTDFVDKQGARIRTSSWRRLRSNGSAARRRRCRQLAVELYDRINKPLPEISQERLEGGSYPRIPKSEVDKPPTSASAWKHLGALAGVIRLANEVHRARLLVQSLSPIEAQILRETVAGGTLSTIAPRLKLGTAEARRCRASMMRKLGAKATADAVRIGIYASLVR
jgi:DNA-binding CsgD family transcriptional regulator